MLYLQVVKEIEVDEELIIGNNIDEWKRLGPSFGYDVVEFIEWLVDTNVLTVDDLGETSHQLITQI